MLKNHKASNHNDLKKTDSAPVSYLCQEYGKATPSGKGNSPRQVAVNSTQPAPIDDPELAAVVEAWSTLPEPIRARIVGLVEGATAQTGVRPARGKA